MKRAALISIISIVVVGTIFVFSTLAADFPTKPIEVIVPFTPGGTNDLLTRLVAQIAPKYLGQPLVVINKPGAGGSLGAAEAISSRPDGYKLVSLPSAFFSTTVHTQKIPFSPDDLVPIASFMEYKEGLGVKGDGPFKTFKDFLDFGRNNPGKLRWGNLSRGSVQYISTSIIFKKLGIKSIEVPYPGTSEMITALLGGHLDAAGITYGGSKDLVRKGAIRFIVSYSNRRFSDPPNVPSAAELGFPEASRIRTLISTYAHKNVPEDIKIILFNAFKKTYDAPEFKKAFEAFGEAPLFLDGPSVKEIVKQGTEVTLPLLKEWGMYVAR
jgi:tripartite-type tricarboxylate transporter receptor subunit TctC